MKRVLVAMDDSPMAASALEHALETFDADVAITVVHVAMERYDMTNLEEAREVGMDRAPTLGDETAQEVFATAARIAEDRDREVTVTLLTGEPTDRLVEYAADGEFDHVVLGSHGREGVAHLVIGSVAETVARRTVVPTTLV